MARNVAKAGAAKGGSCKGFSGPGERCHPAVSKCHRTPFDDRRGQEKGKGWELQGGFSVPGERCHPALSKRHANTIWQQMLPGKGKVWKLERLRRQARKSRCGKDGSCRQQTWLPTDVARPQPMSHTCGDPRRRPGYAILCYFLFFIL